MSRDFDGCRVGEVRPSQVIHTFGIGSIVDLPNISGLVMGLPYWEPPSVPSVIPEPRLLAVVRNHLGPQVKQLVSPPIPHEIDAADPLNPDALKGVPLIAFPRWVKCPMCDLIAPLDFGVFGLKQEPFRPDRTRFVHRNCNKVQGAPPGVMPVRFLRACTNGHLDDFPWREFVCGSGSDCKSVLRLHEFGVSAQADDIIVRCDTCGRSSPMTAAFSDEKRSLIGKCRGRHPHLDTEEECKEEARSMLAGASNLWFSVPLSALSIPSDAGELAQLVEENWALLEHAATKEILSAFRKAGNLDAFARWDDEAIWDAMEAKRGGDEGEGPVDTRTLKDEEWTVFSDPDPGRNSRDFKLALERPPVGYEDLVEKVVRVERLRVVKAQIGFTRILSPGDYADVSEIPAVRRVPIAREQPTWVPASEVRGEGLFIQLREDAVREWESRSEFGDVNAAFFEAHRRFRKIRKIDDPSAGYPSARYVMIHALSHALLRQLSIECGYSAASLQERIYSRGPGSATGPPMAGLLLYTAAADSEGTLGGLVSLGRPRELGRHFGQALEAMRLCASDPLCAEHVPGGEGATLHGAACHACLFASETSCESGNKYLDRSLLIETVAGISVPFFDRNRS
jgi:hypothetical protein